MLLGNCIFRKFIVSFLIWKAIYTLYKTFEKYRKVQVRIEGSYNQYPEININSYCFLWECILPGV